jgi:glycosyltransferase involved in cell wall biosynthesis
MAGDKRSMTKAMKVIEDCGVADRIIIMPSLKYDNMLKHAASCDVGVLLYPDDGTGNYYQAPGRLTEYVGCGLPYVASDYPGLRCITEKYNLGLLCDSESPEAIAGAIRKVCEVSDDEKRQRRERLRKIAKTELAFEAGVKQLKSVVDKVERRN